MSATIHLEKWNFGNKTLEISRKFILKFPVAYVVSLSVSQPVGIIVVE